MTERELALLPAASEFIPEGYRIYAAPKSGGERRWWKVSHIEKGKVCGVPDDGPPEGTKPWNYNRSLGLMTTLGLAGRRWNTAPERKRKR